MILDTIPGIVDASTCEIGICDGKQAELSECATEAEARGSQPLMN